MKDITKEQVEDILKLRYCNVVDSAKHTAFASYKTLAKIFGVSRSLIYHMCQKRFEELRMKKLPLLEQLAYARQKHDRRRWGYRFLKPHEIRWLTASGTLRA